MSGCERGKWDDSKCTNICYLSLPTNVLVMGYYLLLSSGRYGERVKLGNSSAYFGFFVSCTSCRNFD